MSSRKRSKNLAVLSGLTGTVRGKRRIGSLRRLKPRFAVSLFNAGRKRVNAWLRVSPPRDESSLPRPTKSVVRSNKCHVAFLLRTTDHGLRTMSGDHEDP